MTEQNKARTIDEAVAAIEAIADGLAMSVTGAAMHAEAILTHCLAIKRALALSVQNIYQPAVPGGVGDIGDEVIADYGGGT